jgi:acyl-CoA synthetase (AMP-forming)/AMP-acid ligase II
MRAIDYFDKQAEALPDRIAIIDGSARYSYADLRRASQQIARGMWGAGLRGEQPVAIYSINDARVLLCMLGLMRAGAVWVPINYRNAPDANVEYLNYVKTSWLFYHSSYRDRVPELQARVPTLTHLICIDAEGGENPSLEKFMQGGADAKAPTSQDIEWADARGNPDRLVGLVPTGGTTGPAKGVRVTSLSWGTMTEMASHYWRSDSRDPVCLSVAPLSHAAGVVAFTMFTLGATNVVMPGFDALEVLRNIERFYVTHLFLPPTAFYGLLAHPDVRKFDYSSLHVFLLAASPVSPDKLKEGVEIFGPCLSQS